MQFGVIMVTDPPTHPYTNRQDRLQYTVPQLARSVTRTSCRVAEVPVAVAAMAVYHGESNFKLAVKYNAKQLSKKWI